MGLNAKNAPRSGGGQARVEQPLLAIAGYPARVVQIIDLGLQTQRPYQGQEKAPVHELNITYELLDEFCLDEKGVPDEKRPRWMSETMPLRNLAADKAKSTQRYYALDPQGVDEGDFPAQIGKPCLVNVVHNKGSGINSGKTYANVGSISTMREKEAIKAPELVNPSRVFLLDEPDVEIFNALPEFLRDKIKANLEYNGSKLQELLEGKASSKTEKQEEPDEDTNEQAEEDDGQW